MNAHMRCSNGSNVACGGGGSHGRCVIPHWAPADRDTADAVATSLQFVKGEHIAHSLFSLILSLPS